MGRNREFLEIWFRRVWVQRETDAILEMMSPSAAVTGLEETELRGAPEFVLFHKLVTAQFDVISVRIDHSVEEGEWIAALFHFECTHRETGRRLHGRGHVMSRISGGRLVEGHNLLDFIQIFEQAGILPERTLDQLLLGRKPRFFSGATSAGIGEA